jgi:hypothetical protein
LSSATDAPGDVGGDAFNFLQWLRPGGPWVLTAIIPDGPTETITAKSETEVREFVRKYDGKRNLYYSVNPTRRPMTTKAKKTDIAAVEYLLAISTREKVRQPRKRKPGILRRWKNMGPHPRLSSIPATAYKRCGGWRNRLSWMRR